MIDGLDVHATILPAIILPQAAGSTKVNEEERRRCKERRATGIDRSPRKWFYSPKYYFKLPGFNNLTFHFGNPNF